MENTTLSEFAWALSNLSSLVGELTTSSQSGRSIAWASPTHTDYWLYLDFDEQDEVQIKIYDELAPAKEMWAVIGYCVNTKKKYQIV